MLKITFATSDGGLYRAVCRSVDYDPYEGYTLDSVTENSRRTGPCGEAGAPPEWSILRAEEV